MGFHAFLQSQNVPLESFTTKTWNKRIFKQIEEQSDAASSKLAQERGSCQDADACGVQERFSNTIVIAPTVSLLSVTSPGIEPFISNAYTHKILSGTFPMRK